MLTTMTTALLASTLAITIMLGAVTRELRLIRLRLGGHLAFLPWNED